MEKWTCRRIPGCSLANVVINREEAGVRIGAPHRCYRDAEVAPDGGVRATDARLGVGDRIEHDARVTVERIARVGEGQAARRASQRARAEALLETSEPTANGGARNTELSGGADNDFASTVFAKARSSAFSTGAVIWII